MRKKIMLGSVLISLLMLVTTQTMFMENVASWPSEHTGDADVGDMWVTELNTASVLTNVKNVSIGHANATDDWVKWTIGIGTVKADWTVDIENKHPEYWITFVLLVFNIDDNCTAIGNSTHSKTYNANTSYDESGTLSVIVELSQAFISANTNATLLCYLDTSVVINNTAEAVNFTSWSSDRCVVGISIDSEESNEPFSRFTTEANAEWPHIWSWSDGWNESSRFADEEDMLNNQTCFVTGLSEPSENTGDWDLGDFTIKITKGKELVLKFEHGQLNYDAGDQPYVFISCHVGVTVQYIRGPKRYFAYVRYQLWKDNLNPGTPLRHVGWPFFIGTSNYPSYIFARSSEGTPDVEMDGLIWGIVRGKRIRPLLIPDYDDSKYTIKFTGDIHDGASTSEGSHYWEGSCVYQNHSFDVSATSSTSNGITTVQADITEILQSQSCNETVHIFTGDSGDTRVEFTT